MLNCAIRCRRSMIKVSRSAKETIAVRSSILSVLAARNRGALERILMRLGFYFHCLATLIVLHLLPSGLSFAQTEEKLLDDINQLPETERQARKVNGAKKEGGVTWYVAMNRAYAQDLINAFEADYPFLKVNALTGSGGALLSRVLTEYRARTYLYDVFNTRSTTISTLRKADAIIRYRTPYRRSLRDGFYDKEGFFNGIFATPMVFIF